MKSLPDHMNENLIRPEEIGGKTDGLYQLIDQAINKTRESKMKNLKQSIQENFLNESVIDSREEYKGIKYHIMYQTPKGYYIKGGNKEAKEEIFDKKQPYFDSSKEAQDHAELEITGYLDE